MIFFLEITVHPILLVSVTVSGRAVANVLAVIAAAV